LVKEAFLRQAPITRIFYKEAEGLGDLLRAAAEANIPIIEVSETVIRKMSSTEEPQGILATVKMTFAGWDDVVVNKDTILLVLDNIQDPGNLGTILRTALAADVRQIILTNGTVDVYNPKVLRSSMGAVFSTRVLTDKSPEQIVNFCNEVKCTLAVSTMEGDSIFNPKACPNYPLALVIGNEAFGPSTYFLEMAQEKYSIPMFNNVESLNAAMAAGIFLYELRRQAGFL
jgi:TrmH family RNA methyltransferase